MFEDLFRTTIYRLQNALGKRRYLYHGVPRREITPRDARQFENLAKETQQQVELRQQAYQFLAKAAIGQLTSDKLYLEIQQLLTQTQIQRGILTADHRAFLSGQRLELASKQYEVKALLAADADREKQIKASFTRRLAPAAVTVAAEEAGE